MGVARIFPRGGEQYFKKLFKKLSINIQNKFNKFSKNILKICKKNSKNIRNFVEIFFRKLPKCIILAELSQNLRNYGLNFACLDEKDNIL